jgi:hypothetical protein
MGNACFGKSKRGRDLNKIKENSEAQQGMLQGRHLCL